MNRFCNSADPLDFLVPPNSRIMLQSDFLLDPPLLFVQHHEVKTEFWVVYALYQLSQHTTVCIKKIIAFQMLIKHNAVFY